MNSRAFPASFVKKKRERRRRKKTRCKFNQFHRKSRERMRDYLAIFFNESRVISGKRGGWRRVEEEGWNVFRG